MAQALTVDMRTLSACPEQVDRALAVLGISARASLEEATRRYRTLVRRAHPDLHAADEVDRATERTARINAAWQIVRPAAEALDAHRRARRATPPPPGAARVIAAEYVLLGRARVIPVPARPAPRVGQRGAA